MRVVDTIHLDETKLKANNYNTLIAISYVILPIVLLVAIYATSTSAGTAARDFASMSIFP